MTTIVSVRTPAEARRVLPNMLGILAEAHLKAHGKYQCTVNGEKLDVVLGVQK